MRSLKRFVLRLPKLDRWLLFEAAFAIIIIRIMLEWFPLKHVQRAAVHACLRWRSDNSPAPHRIAWAIEKIAHSIAGSTCLVRALAAQALLVRHGYKPCLTIGVAKDEIHFKAHAWVKNEGQILVGDHETGHYATLLVLESSF